MPIRLAECPNSARRAVCASIAVLTLGIAQAGAEIGPKTKVGNKYQQTSTEESVTGLAPGDCDGQTHCQILFSKVHKRKALLVQHVSCNASATAGAVRFGRLQSRIGSDFPVRHTALEFATATGGTYWVLSAPVMHLIKPGERPIVRLFGTVAANWSVTCSISGQLQ